MRPSLIPRDDPQQAVRLRRFFMAGATYLVAILLFCVALSQGIMSAPAVAFIAGAIAAVNLGFFIVLRSGFNRRFSDPSLTVAQIVAATLLLVLVMYHAGPARGVFLLLYFATFIFGVFRLSTREFMRLGVFALSLYAALIVVLALRQPQAIDLRLEVMQWVALASVLIWFALVGGYISQLRHSLRSSNQELRRAMDTIEQMAIRDELTGLYNRRHIMAILGLERERSDRFASAFSVALLDIDHFKRVNDSFGHAVGDAALRTFAVEVAACLRSIDTLGRLGGEEFIIVMPATSLESAARCAERVRAAVEVYDCRDIHPDLRVTVSIGVATYHPGENVDRLLERADRALYRAKRAGRNRIAQEELRSSA